MAVQDKGIGGPFMDIKFKPESMSRIASSVGYSATPYSEAGFQNFLSQNPDAQKRFSEFQQQAKIMAAEGGLIKPKRYAKGGAVDYSNMSQEDLRKAYNPLHNAQVAGDASEAGFGGFSASQEEVYRAAGAELRARKNGARQGRNTTEPAEEITTQGSSDGTTPPPAEESVTRPPLELAPYDVPEVAPVDFIDAGFTQEIWNNLSIRYADPDNAGRRLTQLTNVDMSRATESEQRDMAFLTRTVPYIAPGGRQIPFTQAKATYNQLLRLKTLGVGQKQWIQEYRDQYGIASPTVTEEPGDPPILTRTTALMEGITPEGDPYLTDAMTVTADKVGDVDDSGQEIDPETGRLVGDVSADVTVGEASTIDSISAKDAATIAVADVSDAIKRELENIDPVTGELSEEAMQVAAQMGPEKLAQLNLEPAQLNRIRQVSDVTMEFDEEQAPDAATREYTPEADAATLEGEAPTAEAATFEDETPVATAQDQYNLTPTESARQAETQVAEAAKAAEVPSAEAVESTYQSIVTAAQGRVGQQELLDAEAQGLQITKPITAVAAIAEALNKDAIAKAQQGSFSGMLAEAQQGRVASTQTMQGQMADLMDQFNDGTPAWAAGAMRAANAAMSARGIGGSSIAASAVVQAAMESAMPIAQRDADTFQAMALTNLNNRQQIAIANAASQQNLELANLNNRQQTALQNSASAFSLQSQNLSNTQAVVLANAQIAAAAQTKNLDVKTQTALINAARFAEMNNLNLSYRQQANLQRSSETLQVEMTNLSNSQQTALANLQVRSALVGQELSNEQQTAILTSTQVFDRAQFDANAKQQSFMQDAQAKLALEGRAMDIRQQTSLFNVTNQLREREVELTNEQQTRLFNTTNAMNIEMTELSNKQQTALANAQIDSALTGQELSNQQQVNVIRAARISEVANINFSAEQQRALENARLAQSVDLNNLSNQQAKIMSDAAAMSTADMANLNARQQANAQNAQAFLQMDMQNLSNAQQKTMFNSQAMVNSMLSDQAAQNAAKQFNASSENQVTQYYDNLTAQVGQYNATQQNAMSQYNAGQANAASQFNANVQNQREQYNAQNAMVIAQSNSMWRRQIATADTAAQNRANELNARNTLELSTIAYNNMWGMYKDMFEFAFQAEQSDLERANKLDMASISSSSGGGGSSFGSMAGTLVGIAGSIWSMSDLKLKTNIKEVKAFSNGIKMYSWNWLPNADKFDIDQRQKIGFIAQNVLKVYPDLVEKSEDDKYLRVNYAGVLKKCMG